MKNKEITMWVDSHWYDAICTHMPTTTPEELLTAYFEELCLKLPSDVQQHVRNIIQSEERKAAEERENNRKFSVVRIIELGTEKHLLLEKTFYMDSLVMSGYLRQYLKMAPADRPTYFRDFLSHFCPASSISEEIFNAHVAERLENTGRVTGAFIISLVEGTFGTLNVDGWKTFRINDVSSATYRAMRKKEMAWETRFNAFVEDLEGKSLACDKKGEVL